MGCLNSVEISNFKQKQQYLLIGNKRIIKQTQIAQGAYGQVWKCLEPENNNIYAVKIMRLQTQQLKTMFDKQVRILNKMRTVNAKQIVKLIDSSIQKSDNSESIGYMLLQFSHMSLFEEIQNKRFHNSEIAKILIEILNGLQEMHLQNVYHLDLKPENIILCQNSYKVCDFGSCIQGKIDFRAVAKKDKIQIQESIQSNSTLMYRSPEMIDTTGKQLNEKTDIWMVGLIGYLMMYKKHPFENKGKVAILSPIQFVTDGQLQKVLKKMLIIQMNQRISVVQAISLLKLIE